MAEQVLGGQNANQQEGMQEVGLSPIGRGQAWLGRYKGIHRMAKPAGRHFTEYYPPRRPPAPQHRPDPETPLTN